MNSGSLEAALRDIPLGGLRFFDSIASTNNEAAAWAAASAPDFSLVVAEEQTMGRGRAGRTWLTPAGAALALSLILRPSESQSAHSGRMSGLGALAVASACERLGLKPEIKWPNDVIFRGRKFAGVLVESAWLGDSLQASIIGIGVNVTARSAPPPDGLSFPATCLEEEVGRAVDRSSLVRLILLELARWRGLLDQSDFLQAWQDRLAFRGREVRLVDGGNTILTGTLVGLEADGSARLETNHKTVAVRVGEISLRPSDDRMG